MRKVPKELKSGDVLLDMVYPGTVTVIGLCGDDYVTLHSSEGVVTFTPLQLRKCCMMFTLEE